MGNSFEINRRQSVLKGVAVLAAWGMLMLVYKMMGNRILRKHGIDPESLSDEERDLWGWFVACYCHAYGTALLKYYLL